MIDRISLVSAAVMTLLSIWVLYIGLVLDNITLVAAGVICVALWEALTFFWARIVTARK